MAIRKILSSLTWVLVGVALSIFCQLAFNELIHFNSPNPNTADAHSKEKAIACGLKLLQEPSPPLDCDKILPDEYLYRGWESKVEKSESDYMVLVQSFTGKFYAFYPQRSQLFTFDKFDRQRQ